MLWPAISDQALLIAAIRSVQGRFYQNRRHDRRVNGVNHGLKGAVIDDGRRGAVSNDEGELRGREAKIQWYIHRSDTNGCEEHFHHIRAVQAKVGNAVAGSNVLRDQPVSQSINSVIKLPPGKGSVSREVV